MNVFKFILKFLQKPSQVLVLCLILAAVNVVLDGTLFHIRKLYLNKKNLNQKIQETQIKNQALVKKLKKLSDPKQLGYLEKEARNRFDLAGREDLIFIFPEDE